MEQEFPTLGTMLYANHAAISPWPLRTSRAVSDFARENADSGPMAYARWLEREAGLRRRVADLLNAPGPDDIALLANTSEGISIVAGGLDWREGDNIVTPEGEFVANRIPWEALSETGVEIRSVDIRAADDPEAALAERMDGRSRVLTISSVQWTDGFRLDLQRLGEACRARGALFFVDAIQQFGALRIDVRAAAIDCMAAGSHKWQMGPEGIGVFYCSPEIRDRLRLRRHGWHMLDDPHRFDRPGRTPSPSARRFEPGSPNSLGQVALDASLGLIEETGPQEIERRVLQNSRQLLSGLSDIPGVEPLSRDDGMRLSGIVSFACRRKSLPELHRALKLRKVVCAIRGNAVRLSPHFYQNGKHIGRLMNAVEDAVTCDK